jgi:hypothetical protein
MRQSLVAWVASLSILAGAAAFAACGSDAKNSGFPDPDASGDAVTPVVDAAPVVHDDFRDPILDTGVPPNAPALFAVPDVPLEAGKTGACLFEPELGSLFPKNWLRPRFRFTTSQQENLFEIVMVVPNEKSPLRIYTTKSGYALDKSAWTKITSVGVGTVHVTLRSAVVDAGGKLTGGPWKGVEGDIEIAPVDATGSVVYWTTSDGTVLKGFSIGDETVQPIITPAGADTKCVACHTSTPDGLFAAVSVSSNPDNGDPAAIALRSVDGTSTEPAFLSPAAKQLLARLSQHAPTFSKAHWTNGDRVVLTMLPVAGKSEIVWTDLEAKDAAQGVGWDVLLRDADANGAASASWSHDGKKVVYTSASNVGAGVIANNGKIYTVPYANRKGGTATPLVGAADAAYTQFYPTYSADDRLVAFNRVANGESSYNNKNAEVFVVPESGGAATRLAANDPPACLTTAKSPGVTNSWPKWSPEVKSSGGKDYYFLVFSSTRNAASKGPQLYVAPIVVQGGVIKTYAALYLWNQPEAENNHTPAWDVFQLPGPK